MNLVRQVSPVLITMVGDEYDHTLSLMGRKPFDHVIYSAPMADHLVIGLHIENNFFINDFTGADK